MNFVRHESANPWLDGTPVVALPDSRIGCLLPNGYGDSLHRSSRSIGPDIEPAQPEKLTHR